MEPAYLVQVLTEGIGQFCNQAGSIEAFEATSHPRPNYLDFIQIFLNLSLNLD